MRTDEGPASKSEDSFSQSTNSLRNNINILTQDSAEDGNDFSLSKSIERHEKEEEQYALDLVRSYMTPLCDKGLLEEMIRRYKVLEEIGVRNIDSYINHPKAIEPMPYLVIAIDELADLMMTAPYEVEQTLTRLAQLGRATGIHLIVATQRPSVDVVTGLIKANFPSRISFAVVSQIDSRTILDSSGAERLLGKGDMLFLSSDFPKAQRVQGAYLSDEEINKLVNYWATEKGTPLPEISLELPVNDITNPDFDSGDFPKDELFGKASELAGRYSHISTSLLQRKLRIGYPRAARLIDQLEDAGVIGPEEPGKSREVLIQS